MGMVDIHSHILPAVDDGAKSWEMALEMCQMAADDGITHMVATPHSNDEFRYDRVRYKAMLEELRQKMKGTMGFSLGCDFHMSFDNIMAVRRAPQDFCIGETNYLLVEFSDFGVSRQLLQTLEEFQAMGLIPIITHPERNRILQTKAEWVVSMAEMGCVIQVTANSLTGFWGSAPRRTAEWLLKAGAVHVLASDAHDPERRTPILSKGREVVAKLASQEIATALVIGNPQAIVRGQPLP